MLQEYERDHGTGMDVEQVADEIWSYTSGYPFLVSRIGFIRNEGGRAVIDNRMFEIKMSNYFISKNLEKKDNVKIRGVLVEDVVCDGRFQMDYVLEKFATHYAELYRNSNNHKFLEDNGRLLFGDIWMERRLRKVIF